MRAVPRQSWIALLLALLGWSVAIAGGRACGCILLTFLAGVCCWLLWGGPSPFLAEGALGEVLRHSWLQWACFSPYPAEALGDAVPRRSWLGSAAGLAGVVPCYSWRTRLWVPFPAILGWVPLPGCVE